MPRKHTITLATKVDIYAPAVRAAIKNDPVLKRIQATYCKRIQARVKQIEVREAKKAEAEIHRTFMQNLAEAGVPLWPNETRRFVHVKKTI